VDQCWRDRQCHDVSHLAFTLPVVGALPVFTKKMFVMKVAGDRLDTSARVTVL